MVSVGRILGEEAKEILNIVSPRGRAHFTLHQTPDSNLQEGQPSHELTTIQPNWPPRESHLSMSRDGELAYKEIISSPVLLVEFRI